MNPKKIVCADGAIRSCVLRGSKSRAFILAAGLWAALLCSPFAGAATIPLRAWLNGAQVPLVNAGTGIGTMTFDTVTKLLSWSVTYGGLSGACTAAHFHGPAPAGVNSSPVVGMTCAASPLTGASAALSPTEEAQLLSGQWYINIHTAVNPGGEIRGQVLPVHGDANGDGRADILWRNSTTGDNYGYLMSGLAIAGEGYLPNVPVAWTAAGAGDFDGDGKVDIWWRNTVTGDNYIYLMNGVTVAAGGFLPNVPLTWTVAGVGDFNGDGRADILWRNSANGDNYVYFMNGLTVTGGGYLPSVPTSWSVMGTGDFDGDGKADILWRNTTTGDTYFYLMNGLIVASQGYGRNVPAAWNGGVGGDLDGDGRADIIWRNGTTGDTYFYLMNGMTIASEGYGRNVPTSWEINGVGDYNGDGKIDILWRNKTTGDTYFFLMDGIMVTGEGYGRNVPAPWDVAGMPGGGGGGGGPSLQLVFSFSQGTFGGGNTGLLGFPSPIAYYFANFNINNDPSTPASVFFTGPAGSGLNNTESAAKFLHGDGQGAGFTSPEKTEVPAGGAWSVGYKGQPLYFTLPEPDSAIRGIVVVPTVTLNAGALVGVNWQYKNSAGATVLPPQAFVSKVELRVDGLVNSQVVRLYTQDNIPFATTAHTLSSPVTWSAVTQIQMVIYDDRGNQYTSYWANTPPPAPTISNLNPATALAGGTITITGTNFGCTGCVGGVNAVRFTGPGGSGANGVAAQFTINSPTQLTVTVPAGAQTGTVWLQSIGGNATSGQTFVAQ